MPPRLLVAASALFLAQCAAQPPGAQPFSFVAFGDTPYNEREEVKFVEMIARIGAEPAAFAVHVGDFKNGHNAPCSDELFLRRKAQFDRSPLPMVFTPGDNEWTDCGRASNGSGDPLERLARLRTIFFAGGESLGARRLPMEAQDACLARDGAACTCGPFPENRRWEHGGVVFATLNMQGGTDRDAACRQRASLAWLTQAVERAAHAHALVVFTQVNPFDKRPERYAPYRTALVDAAKALRKPVLFVHGDTHTFRADAPFRDADGKPLANPSRLEVHGSPFVGWVKVGVDPSRPEIFTFDPRLEATILP